MNAVLNKNASISVSESIINDETRTIDSTQLGIGECYAQGDLYFIRISKLPKEAEIRSNRQLAEGETQGSRHICTKGNVYTIPADVLIKQIKSDAKVDVGENYIGPVIQTVDGEAYIEHPEHGDHCYKGDITLVTVYQRSLDAEEREARVRD